MRNTLVYLFVFLSVFLFSQKKEMALSSNWFFKQRGTKAWNKTTIPGNIFTDLYKNKLIPNPFYSDNEKSLQWIETQDWEYRKNFTCTKSIFENSHINLVFEGLDTYASVYLNDSLILTSDNMFRAWTVDVKNHLRQGKNELYITFESPVLFGKEEAAKKSYVLPEGERVYTRKAQFQYGWDFGPRFVGCGIWKPIHLDYWNDVSIENINYSVLDIYDSLARVQFIISTDCNVASDVEYVISGNTDDTVAANTIENRKKIHLEKGINFDTLFVTIPNPKLWWCNGLGQPNLYNFNCELLQDEKVRTSENLNVGIRKIEWVFKKDSIGYSFYFKLNNFPVFMKGANYVPSDIFLKQKSLSDYDEEFKLFKDAHFNMLRVWGGGVYGDDNFYESCDKNGILVWQDFMFACAMYPNSANFLENEKAEIEEQVIRLRNHPSLALFCGNNEIDEAWNNWGWQKQFNYSKEDSAKIWNEYASLFQSIIPKVINKNAPTTGYLSSSPLIGWGHEESLFDSDSHYWGIWWGMQPFEMYEKKVGRFMSEYGFQSMPNMSTFKKFSSPDELKLNSESVKAHQRHKTGSEIIQTYLERDYKIPEKFKDYIYVSQLLQRDGMKIAIEAHRRNKPQCMGSLFWQLNDCWPGISWSAIDFYNHPKAFYYSLKKTFNTNLVSISKNSDGLLVSAVSDSLINFSAKLKVQLVSFSNSVLWQEDAELKLSNSSTAQFIISKNKLPSFDSTTCYIRAELTNNQKVFADTYYFFVKPKKLNLSKARISIKKIGAVTYEITSSVFAKDICLFSSSEELVFSDNYFNLEAGQVKRVIIIENKKKSVNHNLKATCLNNL